MMSCASQPFCRRAQGIICTTDDDCFNGYSCYQPPQPDCLPGATTCPQAKPSYCVKQGADRCTTDSDCAAWEKCYQPLTGSNCPEGAICPAVELGKYCRALDD